MYFMLVGWLVGWLVVFYVPFTIPCEGCEARFLHRSHRESNPGCPIHYLCATPAQLFMLVYTF